MAFPYDTIQKEKIKCNFCDEDNYKILSKIGTDGLNLTSVICKKCGLIYINPRMTKDGYSEYYENEYRSKTIVNGEKGSDFNCKKLHDTTKIHGKALAKLISPHLNIKGKIMEVGSGAGGVLAGMKEYLSREVVGIEPSKQESDYANTVGIKTFHSLIEDFQGDEKYAAIVSTQSLNHFLDPRYFFKWSHSSLLSEGLLVIEVMNFRQQLKTAGKYENAVKIDHVYMFTPEVLEDFVKSAGFEIVYSDSDEFLQKEYAQGIPRLHIRIIAKKLPVEPFSELIIKSTNYKKVLWSINKYMVYFRYLIKIRLPMVLKKVFKS